MWPAEERGLVSCIEQYEDLITTKNNQGYTLRIVFYIYEQILY